MERCYRVKVMTTNASNDTTVVMGESEIYRKCKDSVLYIITDTPEEIFKNYSVISIEDIGYGYTL